MPMRVFAHVGENLRPLVGVLRGGLTFPCPADDGKFRWKASAIFQHPPPGLGNIG